MYILYLETTALYNVFLYICHDNVCPVMEMGRGGATQESHNYPEIPEIDFYTFRVRPRGHRNVYLSRQEILVVTKLISAKKCQYFDSH